MTTAFSERYDSALAFAAVAHRNQIRKGTTTPYITHVVHVSVILIRHGFGEDVVIAGLLHDVVEDCGVPLETLQAQFGDTVTRLVDAVSEHKVSGAVERPWQQRKAEKLEYLRAGGPDVAALKAADTLHNARSVAADLHADGPQVWRRFKGSSDQTLWYYHEVLAGVRHWLGDHPLVAELEAAIADVSLLAERA